MVEELDQSPASPQPRIDVRPEQFERRARLVSAIARGRRWLDDVVSGRVTTVAELCAREKCSARPKGRVKQSRNMRTIVQQVLNEDMQIREGGRLRRMSAMEALVRTTLARSFKGDPKALASLIVIMRQSGYGPDRDEPSADLLSTTDYEAIVADYLARNLSSDEADPEIGASNERSTPTVSSTEPD